MAKKLKQDAKIKEVQNERDNVRKLHNVKQSGGKPPNPEEKNTGIMSFLGNALNFIIHDDDVVMFSDNTELFDEKSDYEEESLQERTSDNIINFFSEKLHGEDSRYEIKFIANEKITKKIKFMKKKIKRNHNKKYQFKIKLKRVDKKSKKNKNDFGQVFDQIRNNLKYPSASAHLPVNDSGENEYKKSFKKTEINNNSTTTFVKAKHVRSYSFGITDNNSTVPSSDNLAQEEKKESEEKELLKNIQKQTVKRAAPFQRKKIESDNQYEEDVDEEDEEDNEDENTYEDADEYRHREKSEYIKGDEKEKSVFTYFINKKKLLNYIKKFFIVSFSVIAGSITMPFGLNPLGLSLICAADKYIFYIYAGLVLSLVTVKEINMIFFVLYSAVAILKFYIKFHKQKSKSKILHKSVSFKNLNKDEKQKILNMFHFNDAGITVLSLLISAISGCVLGISKLIVNQTFVYSDIIQIMLFILIGLLFTYLYSGLFEVGVDNKTLEKSGICATIFTVVYSMAGIFLLNLSIGYIFSFVITLTAANSTMTSKENAGKIFEDEDNEESDVNAEYNKDLENRFTINIISNDGTMSNMTKGAIVGILCGIALGDTAAAVTLSVCGLISGLFFNQSAVLAIIAGVISSISYSIYIAGIDAIQHYIVNMIIAMTFYIPLHRIYSSVMNGIIKENNKKLFPLQEKGVMLTELPAAKLNTLSDAFSNLSETFYQLSDKMKYPSKTETRAMVESCIENQCKLCELHENCYLRNRTNINPFIRSIADNVISKGRINLSNVSNIENMKLFENCIKKDEYIKSINSLYRKRIEDNLKNDKTMIFASNYETISNLLANSRSSGKEDIFFQKEMSEKIFIRFQNMGIECENVVVLGKRRKSIYVFGIKMSDYAGTIAEILDLFESVCKTSFSEPEYILKENYVTMKTKSKNKYKIYTIQSSRSAENYDGTLNKGDEINGDSSVYFAGHEGLYYSLISDGMGSGKQAALASKLTVLMMEKLLSAGNMKDLTLEMINTLLLAKGDECFATVDLFEADLITGQATFIKAGAAPSFVIRNKRIFKIQSSTVPAGILNHMNTEQTKFDLEDGDYIVMVSDGIVSTFEESSWLLNMLGAINEVKDFKKFLNDIQNTAREKNARVDDMSIQITRILESR